MSLALAHSRALDGLSAPSVLVEVHLANGLPCFTLVGLPDTEVKEARDRVRAAISNSGFEFPARRVTVNLAPADLPKESGRFDLPIALGVLAASGQIPKKPLENYEFAGELSLSGALRPVRGALAMVLNANLEHRHFVLPADSAIEAALTGSKSILSAESLLAVCAHLCDKESLSPPPLATTTQSIDYPDLQEVRGQNQAKRALEIAAAGGHSLLLSGPPGTGKSMLATRLPGLLPPLTAQEARESAAMLSLAGVFSPDHYGKRVYRSPHHTASAVALVGGGNPPRPGEISLSHHGLLFLDELPEFDRKVLETLREPLESGHIHIARAGRHARFPATFQLVAAMNPCPCGYQGDPRCRCTIDQISRYKARISGPLLDRIDIFIDVPSVPAETLANRPDGESSAAVQARVVTARLRQHHRQGVINARLDSAGIDQHCPMLDAARSLLVSATERLGLSARAWHRILKLARTIADLAGQDSIDSRAIAEAIQYRRARQA